MANEEEKDLSGVEEEEETTKEQESTEDESDDESKEETVTLSKKDFKSLDRKARAYDSTKSKKEELQTKDTDTFDQDSVIKTVSALRSVSDDEIEILENEANTLGVPLVKYIKSESGKTLLKNIRQQKKSKEADIDSSPKSPVYKKHTADDLNQMSSAELEKILPHA